MRQIALVCALFLLSAALPESVKSPRQLQVTSIKYDRKLPLVDALVKIGTHLRGFVSFGVDISEGTEPEVDINMPDTDLGDALQRITSQITGYSSEIVSPHVVEIYPAKDRSNPQDALNLPIREFSVSDVPALMIFSSPTRYIPELKSYLSKGHKDSELGCGSLGPGLGSYAIGVSLFLTGRNVRQILDAVAEADAVLPVIPDSPHSNPPRFRMPPAGWVRKRTSDPKLGVVDTWSSISFAPNDWKLYAPK